MPHCVLRTQLLCSLLRCAEQAERLSSAPCEPARVTLRCRTQPLWGARSSQISRRLPTPSQTARTAFWSLSASLMAHSWTPSRCQSAQTACALWRSAQGACCWTFCSWQARYLPLSHNAAACNRQPSALAGTVDAHATRTSLQGSRLHVELRKQSAQPWPSLEPEQVDCSSSAQQPGQAAASSALAEREKVRALLSAAQGDSREQLEAAAAGFQASDLSRVRDANGMTAVHFAAKEGRLANLRYLVDDLSLSADLRSDAGKTTLLAAADCDRQCCRCRFWHNEGIH